MKLSLDNIRSVKQGNTPWLLLLFGNDLVLHTLWSQLLLKAGAASRMNEKEFLDLLPHQQHQADLFASSSPQKILYIQDATEKGRDVYKSFLENCKDYEGMILSAPSLRTTHSLVQWALKSPSPVFASACYDAGPTHLAQALKAWAEKEDRPLKPQDLYFLTEHFSCEDFFDLTLRISLCPSQELEPWIKHNSVACAQMSQVSIEFLYRRLPSFLKVLSSLGDNLIEFCRFTGRKLALVASLRQRMQNHTSLEEAIAAFKPPLFFKDVALIKDIFPLWTPQRLYHGAQALLQAEIYGKIATPCLARHALVGALAEI